MARLRFPPCVPALLLLAGVFWGALTPLGRLVVVAAERGEPGTFASPEQPWADFVEADYPFFSSVLEARRLGSGWPTNNLVPRGLILNLGHGMWACFDLDLLRWAAVWEGSGVTPVSMAQGSYHEAGRKAPEGQRSLPEIRGTPWCASGLHPGWWRGTNLARWLEDPRPPTVDPREVGRGPLPVGLGGFEGLRIERSAVQLEYRVFSIPVAEMAWAGGQAPGAAPVRAGEARRWVVRDVTVGASTEVLNMWVGSRPAGASGPWQVRVEPPEAADVFQPQPGSWALRWRPSASSRSARVSFGPGQPGSGRDSAGEVGGDATGRSARRWPTEVVTRGVISSAREAVVVDDVLLPWGNPWRRNVRVADIAFQTDGRAFVVTFDGDVWAVAGLTGELASVRWRRFASGLHEPLGVVVRAGELFVHDRNGLWRLQDRDGDGEADRHELFSSVFAQTAETREFATGFRVAPDGSFVLAKGGQQTSTLGRDNGTVLRVSPDGRSYETLGWGLREPFIGVHPKTGWVTASDQQGHYVPATPLHLIAGNRFYGFISLLLPKERYPAPIVPPVTWIPHPVNASGASQAWLVDGDYGPLDGAMVHLGYFRPELFLVRWSGAGEASRAAVMSLTRDLQFAPLNAAMNPADRRLYVAGFQIWGTAARRIAGLARLRLTDVAVPWPREIVPTDRGVLLRFDQPLGASSATNPTAYSVERWNYRRTANYGSPHFRLDGSRGQETLWPSAVLLSSDGRAVLVVLPGMQPVDQMRVGWNVTSIGGAPLSSSAYFTPARLVPFDAEAEGFAAMSPEWWAGRMVAGSRPPAGEASAASPPTAAEGRRVAELMGCVACHSDDGSTVGRSGPTWRGLYMSERPIAGGGRVRADEEYLRESIREPQAKIVRGFETGDVGMPSYDGVITPAQIEALVLHLKTLR